MLSEHCVFNVKTGAGTNLVDVIIFRLLINAVLLFLEKKSKLSSRYRLVLL